jgi:hypothetical protein
MAKKEASNTSAKLLYRPIGLASSMASGALAGILFKQLWKRISPGADNEAPKALKSEFNLREVLLAAALQGALYALVKALVDRGGARAFQRLTGDWPGD